MVKKILTFLFFLTYSISGMSKYSKIIVLPQKKELAECLKKAGFAILVHNTDLVSELAKKSIHSHELILPISNSIKQVRDTDTSCAQVSIDLTTPLDDLICEALKCILKDEKEIEKLKNLGFLKVATDV